MNRFGHYVGGVLAGIALCGGIAGAALLSTAGQVYVGGLTIGGFALVTFASLLDWMTQKQPPWNEP